MRVHPPTRRRPRRAARPSRAARPAPSGPRALSPRRYGTRVNGKALGAEPVEIKEGDILVLGASSFQVQAAGK